MAKRQSPLLGYNTNIRHEGKVYHIQTEDSGVERPHIITHLFADGGRIVASRKTDYRHHLQEENLEEVVRNLMKEQHKAMAIALRDREFDEAQSAALEQPAPAALEQPVLAALEQSASLDADALERAAAARQASSPGWSSWLSADEKPVSAAKDPYHIPARETGEIKQPTAPSIFGSDSSEEMSLDEVILGFLHEDTQDKR